MKSRLPWYLAVNAAVSVALILLLLGATEAWLRLTIPSSSGGSIFEYTLDTKRYKRYKKNAHITAWGVDFRTNELGFRDNRTQVPPKQEGVFRIVVLGDSFTTSAGVPFEQIYSSLLEQRLSENPGNIEVINLATGGYNIIQYQLVLEEAGLPLDPDLILVGLFPYNDLGSDDYRGQLQRASGAMEETAKPARDPWYSKLYVYRAYLNKVAWRLRAMFAGRKAPDRQAKEKRQRISEQDKTDNLNALTRIHEIGMARSIPVVSMMLPNTDSFAPQQQKFGIFEQHCRSTGMTCINLLDAFVTSGKHPYSLRLNAIDSHPNPAYHVIVTDAIVPAVKDIIRPEHGFVSPAD